MRETAGVETGIYRRANGDRYIPPGDLRRSVPGFTPESVPLYADRETVEREYAAAQRDGTPFFAVERHEDGYAITYDLLPAGAQLTDTAREAVADRLTEEVEAVVADDDRPTTEISRSVNASLGSVSLFEREDSARRVAAGLSGLVLDREHWERAEAPGAGERRN
jgi:hypothetical protein